MLLSNEGSRHEFIQMVGETCVGDVHLEVEGSVLSNHDRSGSKDFKVFESLIAPWGGGRVVTSLAWAISEAEKNLIPHLAPALQSIRTGQGYRQIVALQYVSYQSRCLSLLSRANYDLGNELRGFKVHLDP